MTACKHTARTVAKYHRERRQLVREMGDRCVHCGESRYELLEFHHTGPRRWVASQKARWTRLKLYRAEWEQKILELACKECNKRLGEPDGGLRDGY